MSKVKLSNTHAQLSLQVNCMKWTYELLCITKQNTLSLRPTGHKIEIKYVISKKTVGNINPWVLSYFY